MTAADFGETVRGARHPLSLVFAAMWAFPVIAATFAVRTVGATVVGIPVLFAATVWLLFAVFGDEHSTAGVGLLAGPALLSFVALLVWLLDRALDSRLRRSAGLR